MRRFLLILIPAVMVTCTELRPTPLPQTSSPSSRAPCSRAGVSFAPFGEGAGGAAVVGLEVHHGGRPCHLQATVTLKVEGTMGTMLSIEGNPSTTAIERSLPQEPEGVMWQWRNSCGDDMAIRFVFTVLDERLSLDSRAGPRCDEPTAGSTLTAIDT